MEIHWVGFADLSAEERAEIEARVEALGAGHSDLIDVRLTGRKTGHHQHGAQEARITCQARGREIVATRTRPDLGLALNEALDARGPEYLPRTEHLESDGAPLYTNRLILEDSPYLLQHAHNPVNWYAWGPEAFATAARTRTRWTFPSRRTVSRRT